MYVEYDFYKTTYGGELVPENVWEAAEARAALFVDRITFNRLQSTPPAHESHWISVRFAVCQVAEAMHAVKNYKLQALRSINSGTAQGKVKSMTSGAESVTYSESSMNIGAYQAAAESPTAEESLYYSLAAPYLANIPDARGINLLYAGA